MTCALLVPVLLVGSAALLLWSTFMLARNAWVYRKRIEMLHEDYRRYQRLPDYAEMMRRWWIWDVDRFLAPKSGRK